MRIGLFVQDISPEKCNRDELEKSIKKAAESKLDILVFPDNCYTNFSKMASNFDMLDFDSGYIIAGFCDDLSNKADCAIVFSGSDMFSMPFNMLSNGKAGGEGVGFKLYVKHFNKELSPFQMDDYKEWAESFFTPFPYAEKSLCMMDGKDAQFSVLSSVGKKNGGDLFINILDADADYNEAFRLNRVRAFETKSFVFGLTPAKGEKSGAFTFGFAPDGSLMEGVPVYDSGASAGNIFVYDTESYNSEEISLCDEDEVLAENPDFVLDCELTEDLVKTSEKLTDEIYVKELNGINLVTIVLKNEEIGDAVKTADVFYNPKLKEIENKRYLLINKWDKDLGEYDGIIDDMMAVRTIENKCVTLLCAADSKKCCQLDKAGRYIVLDGEAGRFGVAFDVAGGPELVFNDEGGDWPSAWRIYYEALLRYVHGEKLVSDEELAAKAAKKEVNFDML